MSFLTKIFGDANKRVTDKLHGKVEEVSAWEEKVKKLKEDDFKKKTEDFKKKLAGKELEEQQKILEEILPECFALVREAAARTLGQRHYDVQLIAGMVLHQGNIAEMKTGEGKTLSATAAVYLNALTGRGVHVITVNDYLARRDMVWMGQIYDYLGLTVGCLNHESAYLYDKSAISDKRQETSDKERDTIGVFKVVEEFLRPVERKLAYAADITYGTNNEYGFDYLRDNMVADLSQKVQRELHYTIVDEVDSILIDEARTPLIISAPDSEATDKYNQFAQLVARLSEGEDYNIDEKMRAATLTEEGIKKMEKMLGVENIYTDRGVREVHHIENALKARVLFKLDRDYVVKDNEVIIVDEFTGRLMLGRRYSDGLHQAIEAKEGVKIQQESVTMATITFQNYFRMYKKLAGMTGTAATEAEEFSKIYNLDVIQIPTNKPMIRIDHGDIILKTEKEKYGAIVEEIKLRHNLGQPVLVGTISIENNEHLSSLLSREGVEHRVLNAKQHEKEAEIIAQAGRLKAVTIATNMAGRGVDIILGGNPSSEEEQEEIKKLGGLHVMGTERHESRRIDNQLRGRTGRQGDPGSSQFFVSMEDDLMRIFGGERMKNLMSSLGLPEGMPIKNRMISNSIEKAQQKVEGHNFDIRKHLVEYDDVINKHREVIYKKRNEILSGKNNKEISRLAPLGAGNKEIKEISSLKTTILDYVREEIETVVKFHTQSENESSWNLDEIYEVVDTITPMPLEVRLNLEDIRDHESIKTLKHENKEAEIDNSMRGRLVFYLYGLAEKQYNLLENKINSDENLKKQFNGAEPMRLVERSVLLRAIDMLWVEHIDQMDHMRQGIGLVGYGQKDPLIEYKREAYRMFNELLTNIRKQVVYSIFKISITNSNTNSTIPAPIKNNVSLSAGALNGRLGAQAEKLKKVGRNDPCPCGSGKKYKKCHGA